MQSGRQRFSQFYSVSEKGGLPQKLPVAYGEFGAISKNRDAEPPGALGCRVLVSVACRRTRMPQTLDR